jgi:hypothetical protein
MSAQTALGKPTGEPVTPVIVKVGGDDDYGDNRPRTSSPVSIDSASLSFAETVAGPTWAASVSRKAGRIIGLTIIDGSNTTSLEVTPGSDLASITIRFGPTQLVARESGMPAQNEVFLLIMSPDVPFHVAEHGDWKVSNTNFPNKVTSLILMVGDTEKLNYEFQSDDATVQIDFDLN